MGFRFSSPSLLEDGEPLVIKECPVGLVIREAPYVFQAIRIANYVENGAVNPLELSPWTQQAIAIVSSERARLREETKDGDQAVRDSEYRLRMNRG